MAKRTRRVSAVERMVAYESLEYDLKAYDERVRALPWISASLAQPPHPLHEDPPHQSGTRMDLAECEWVVDQLAKNNRFVLDVGCGDGWTVRQFLDRGLKAVGVTISGVDVSEAVKHGLAGHVLFGDMQALPWPDAHFDLVWARHSLEHAMAPYVALMEFRRVLRQDQWLFVGMPLESGPWVDVGPHYWVPTRKQAVAMFKKCGFSLEKEWVHEHGTGQQSYFLRKR